MLRMLIAEDESFFREGLLTVIDWSRYGIEVSGVAENGRQAMAMIVSDPPDLLLTDIRMPYMSGLELIKSAQEAGHEFYSILLTGYNEFEYAKEAIKLSVSDYVLKPCGPDDIIQVVLNVKQKIEESQKIRALLRGLEQTSERMPDIADVQETAERNKPLHRTVQAAIQLIESKYNTNLTLDQAAREAFVSSSYLSSLFKQELGVGFLDYLHQYRTERAKTLLAEQLKVFAVAKLVGYQEVRHFSSTFKKWTGLTPRQYQQSETSHLQ